MNAKAPKHQFHPTLTVEERDLGMDGDITRRDFLDKVLLGAGASLLAGAAPDVARSSSSIGPESPSDAYHPWTGYGGVGDYANCNGNTWEVVTAGHGIRDNAYEKAASSAVPTGETYDLVIVGGGFAGAIAAYTFMKDTHRARPVLLLDNHPLMGGEAKRNEFVVRGQKLIGPQGSNLTPVFTSGWAGELWSELGLPTQPEFAALSSRWKNLSLALFNSPNGGEGGGADLNSYGHFFKVPRPHWVTNPWANHLAGTPWPAEVRHDLLRWRDEVVAEFQGTESSVEKWLDTITYEQYLTQFRKLRPEVARYADKLLSGEGLGSDVLSACVAYRADMPGFDGLWRGSHKASVLQAPESQSGRPVFQQVFSFPGGNDAIMRALVKWLNPDVIEGSAAFADVHNSRIRFDAMDNPGRTCRMRTGATVVQVVHDAEGTGRGKVASITYIKQGRAYSVRARTVIWAAASWSGQHAIKNASQEYRVAMTGFPRSPAMIVNVALNNWRALYKLGYTSCSWDGDFGFYGNLRAPMEVGTYHPAIDPDESTIFTMKVLFPQLGLSLADQGRVGRATLYATSYRDFERQIRAQLQTLLGGAGFDAGRDIAGIVLNRWGHAYVNCGPGFFFGQNGRRASSEVLRQPLGNLGFAHSELPGVQSWWGAGEEGVRAARQALAML